MRLYIRTFAAIVFAATAIQASAQEVRSGYFNESYLYRHNLNPALGNEEDYISVPVVGNFNASMMGNFGYEELVRKNPLYPDRSDKKVTSFMNPYLTNGLTGFSSGDNKMSGQVKVSVMSAGFKKWGGYNTIELNVRGFAGVSVPYQMFEMAVNASNKRYDIGDMSFDAQAFTELAVGHSRQIDEKLRVGGKAKLLVGVANASVNLENVTADLKDANQWVITADGKSQVSMNGFKYKNKSKEYYSQPGTYNYVSDVDMGTPGVSGFGLAVDAGASYKINEDLTVYGALQDLGAIIWTQNYVATNKRNSFVFDGFHDVDIKSESGEVLDDKADKYTDQLLDFMHLSDDGDDGARLTGIGGTLNVGLQYTVPTYRQLRVGLLGTTSSYFGWKYRWSELRLSGNIAPVDWFEGSLSFGVNSYAFNTGFLANFHTKGFNFFLGMDAILGKVSKEFIPLSSNGGVSFGFNIML